MHSLKCCRFVFGHVTLFYRNYCNGAQSLSHPSLGWLYVFSSFLPPPQPLLLLPSKPFKLNLRYLRQRKYRYAEMYWMTLTQGDSCANDLQKVAGLHHKVQPFTTKIGSNIPIVLLTTWWNFGGIQLKTFLDIFFFEIPHVFLSQTFYWP